MIKANLILAKGKEASLKRFHPWVFSGAIRKTEGIPQEGDLVRVLAHDGEFLGLGHYQKSSIAVRILNFKDAQPDEAWWISKISQALHLRQVAGLSGSPGTNVFRLVHGEGDLLPGLIIDYYAGMAVVQAHSAGMYFALDKIINALSQVLGEQLTGIYDKSSQTLPHKSGIKAEDKLIFGAEHKGMVKENGFLFRIDWEKGQKTGFFIDQRENRALLLNYSKGRRVLNLFGYTGGFSVYALGAGADLVHTVDSSARAIEMTEENVALNFGADKRHQSFAEDVFTFLKRGNQKYDLVICDPPAFAKHGDALANALQGYRKLNRAAMEALNPGGMLFTFSCSQAVDRDQFRKSVFVAAANTGHSYQIIHQLTQPADHPVSIYHPEGEYLKGLVVRRSK